MIKMWNWLVDHYLLVSLVVTQMYSFLMMKRRNVQSMKKANYVCVVHR